MYLKLSFFYKMNHLIEWCKQYLKPNQNFIDMSCHDGSFSIMLSSCCQQVIAFDCDTNHCVNLSKKNINNLIVYQYNDTLMIDKLKIKDVGLIKIEGHLEQNLIGLIDTLENNHYPPIIYYDQDNQNNIKKFLTIKGYQIHFINGYPNWYLVSDHQDYKSYNYNLDDAEKIILSPQSNDVLISSTLSNAFQYMNKLSTLSIMLLNIPMKHDRVPNNPSIYQCYDGYLCNVRASNYVYEPQFRFLDGGQVHKSDHYMLKLNNDFNITSTRLLTDVTNNVYYSSFVEGIDDLRLIDNHYFLCSHGNFSQTRVIKQCLGYFNDDGHVTSLIPLKGPFEMRHEKNWLPFINNNDIYVIYTLHPFVLYQVNKETGDLILIKNEKLTDLNLNNFRGSAGPIKYKNGWLMTAHQVCHQQFNYFHRFVWLSEDFVTIKWSQPFYFDIKGVEFNCGLCLSHDNNIILTHSIWDNHARLIVVDYHVVDDMLKI